MKARRGVEVLRRLYHDLVIGRSTVRVIEATAPGNSTQPPIFLVGVYRSGTTLLRYIIDSHSRICCPPESFFLASLQPFVELEANQTAFLRMGFDQDHVLQRVRQFSQYFFENYAASHQKPRWADKSPNYVDHLPFLLKLFPDSVFVMLYRHGLDQAHSFTRGGTFDRDVIRAFQQENEDRRLGAVRYWREKVELMLEFERNHPSKCIRLRYEDLCTDPEAILRPVFHFLDEPWEPEVLEFYDKPHDKGAEDGRAAATRGFSISHGHYRQWSAELLKSALDVAQPTLDKLGYRTPTQTSSE